MPAAALLLLALASRAEAPGKVLLFVGDSLTAGYGLAPEQSYPALIGARLKRKGLPWTVRNAAVSGSTTAGALEALDWQLDGSVGLVLIASGANDGLRGLPVEDSRRNLAALVVEAKRRGARVALAGMRIPPNYGDGYARRFEAMYRSVAKQKKVPLLPFLLDGVGGRPEMNLPDGIHPNARGHRAMADSVQAFLEREGLLR